jgi:hypothetical protein
VVLPAIIYILLALALLVAGTNYVTDPAGIYRPAKSKQARNLRLRKLSLLKGVKRAPCATLVLGSSRVFNLSLNGDERFPQPTLNLAVTTAKAEDYLASYELVREAVGAAPAHPSSMHSTSAVEFCIEEGRAGATPTHHSPIRLVIIGIEHPAFHPTMKPQWESYTAGKYTDELQQIGAVQITRAWRWRMLLSPLQFHQSLIVLQRRWRERKGAKQKFRWSADGSGTWMDLLEGKRNPRLLRRQLRNFPRTGLAVRSYTRAGEQRLRWFEELLAQCQLDGAQAVAYIVPAHPLLVEKTWELGFKPMHDKLVEALSHACSAYGALFADWYDGSELGLNEQHFRDVMHLRDEGQAVIKERLVAAASLPPS